MAEIERKFLVEYIPDLEGASSRNILQGYINLSPEVRIRKDGINFYLTKKSDDLLVREEMEEEISFKVFEMLKYAIVGNLISKRRYVLPLDEKLSAELDIYQGLLEGLFTVEVEFPSVDEAASFVCPDWFGEEITYDKRYKNKNLANINSLDDLKDNKKLVKKDV